MPPADLPEDADSAKAGQAGGSSAPDSASSATGPKAWAGRFESGADAAAEAFTGSIGFDQRLAEVDIRGSIAHAEMLAHCGIVSLDEARSLIRGLEELLADVRRGAVTWDPSAEDIHMNVERQLYARIGDVAGKLHTARSRNDQVATDTRLWLREQIDGIRAEVALLQETLIVLAERHSTAILPGYTHTQHAQPVLLAHHLLAYFWMLQRDQERLIECRARVNVMPLGAGALAGTPHPIDRDFVAAKLGFDRPAPNSMDAVSDRDFVIEAIADGSLLMMHLSRLCNELVLWQSREYGFVMMADAMTTGSSMMPQKKNPDVAELIRGKSGRVYGNLVTVLTVMKALPLTYNSDMQEDKESLFDTIDTQRSCLRILTRLLQTTEFRTDRMEAATQGDYSTATDLADALAAKGLPFREAYQLVGGLVKESLRSGKSLETLETLTPVELRSLSPLLDREALASLKPRSSVEARITYGGTAPGRVEHQLKEAKDCLRQTWQRIPGSQGSSAESPL